MLTPIQQKQADRLRARKLGTYKGKAVYDFPVVLKQSWLDHTGLGEVTAYTRVIAQDPASAYYWVREKIGPALERPTQFHVIGPAGGKREFYMGWESIIGAQLTAEVLSAERKQIQLIPV